MKDLTIGFIGLGLIGGSIARGIKRSRRDVRIMAYMRSRDKLEQAKRDGVVDVILDGIGEDVLTAAYQAQMDQVRTLLIRKNTDYGDAWKSMSLGAMTDQVIIRVYRIRKILANGGKCTVSEGVSAQLHDVINYCVFALIKMGAEFLN